MALLWRLLRNSQRAVNLLLTERCLQKPATRKGLWNQTNVKSCPKRRPIQQAVQESSIGSYHVLVATRGKRLRVLNFAPNSSVWATQGGTKGDQFCQFCWESSENSSEHIFWGHILKITSNLALLAHDQSHIVSLPLRKIDFHQRRYTALMRRCLKNWGPNHEGSLMGSSDEKIWPCQGNCWAGQERIKLDQKCVSSRARSKIGKELGGKIQKGNLLS